MPSRLVEGFEQKHHPPAKFFDNPQHERTRLFLSQILRR
jgi:ABC-type polar amino acid transport system ATPase subunit